MAKKIIKVGLAKTKEKDDCIRSEKKERFIAQAARGWAGALTRADDAKILRMSLQAEF